MVAVLPALVYENRGSLRRNARNSSKLPLKAEVAMTLSISARMRATSERPMLWICCGLWLISLQSEEMAIVAKMDWAMLALTLGLSLVASILAGLLPTWRACQVTPALQLKTQ